MSRPTHIAAALVMCLGMLRGASATDLKTRAESSNYEETSTYADVTRIVSGLAAASTLVHVESFGKTEEGRDMPLMIISDPKVSTPEEARKLGRPVVLVQANIHAGEVEGKEAALILARRLVSGDLQPLTRELVILIAPDYNADGNERVNVLNRTHQNGPVAGVGVRENAHGLDLNRDYMKLETAEARALVGLMNRWNPHVIVDLHTTNGSYHGYHLTYSPILNPNADPGLIEFSRARMLPAIRRALHEKHGYRSYYYGNFTPEDDRPNEHDRIDPAKPGNAVWRTFDHRPRFGNNYVGLRNRIAILSEAYSYLDFQGRIEVTAAFVEEICRYTAAHAASIRQLVAEADRRCAEPSESEPMSLGVSFENRAIPGAVELLVGDVRKQRNPRSGRDMLQMTELAAPVAMKDYGIFAPVATRRMPAGWLIPADQAGHGRLAVAIDRLRKHGIEARTITAAKDRVPVEQFVIEDIVRAGRVYQGHHETRLRGSMRKAEVTAAAGSIFIPSNQPLARLAFYLLEPESDDGFVTWNVIDEGLAHGEVYPVHRVTQAAGL